MCERFFLLIQMEVLLYTVFLPSELRRRLRLLLANWPSSLLLRVQDSSCSRTARLKRQGLLELIESTLEKPCVSSRFHP